MTLTIVVTKGLQASHEKFHLGRLGGSLLGSSGVGDRPAGKVWS